MSQCLPCDQSLGGIQPPPGSSDAGKSEFFRPGMDLVVCPLLCRRQATCSSWPKVTVNASTGSGTTFLAFRLHENSMKFRTSIFKTSNTYAAVGIVFCTKFAFEIGVC